MDVSKKIINDVRTIARAVGCFIETNATRLTGDALESLRKTNKYANSFLKEYNAFVKKAASPQGVTKEEEEKFSVSYNTAVGLVNKIELCHEHGCDKFTTFIYNYLLDRVVKAGRNIWKDPVVESVPAPVKECKQVCKLAHVPATWKFEYIGCEDDILHRFEYELSEDETKDKAYQRCINLLNQFENNVEESEGFDAEYIKAYDYEALVDEE